MRLTVGMLRVASRLMFGYVMESKIFEVLNRLQSYLIARKYKIQSVAVCV